MENLKIGEFIKPLRFSFWVCNKEDEIISNGYIVARDYKRAKDIFKGSLKNIRSEGEKIGEYFLSETPECFIKNY